MTIPLTPFLQTIQSAAPQEAATGSIRDRVQTVIELLDAFTFNPQEAQILTLASELSPAEFVSFITYLALSEYQEYDRSPYAKTSRSYLQKLYEDLHGEEFRAFNLIMKSKLLAYKSGSVAEFNAVAQAALAGERPAVFAAYETYMPVKLTSPASWAGGSIPTGAGFDENGLLRLTWLKRSAWYTVQGHQRHTLTLKPTALAVLTHTEIPGKVEFTTVLELKELADKAHRGRWFDTINIVGIVFGAAAFAAAKGAAQQAVIGLFQVAIPAAGQYVSDHEAEIIKMKYGPQFIFAWQIFNLGMAAYGIGRMVGPAGKAIFNRLKQAADDLSANNPLDDIAETLSTQVAKLEDAVDEMKAKVIDQGIGPSSTGGGSGQPPRPPRQPIDPGFPPPSTIPGGGRAIATGKTEIEIVYELDRLGNHPDDVAIFRHESSGHYLLVDYPGGSAKMAGRPTGFARADRVRRILSISKRRAGPEKRYFDEIANQQQQGGQTEFGLYQKQYPDGTVRYAAVHGTEGAVARPDEGWRCLAHFHPGSPKDPGFHNPAPQDFSTLTRDMVQTQQNARTEVVHSFDQAGALVEVRFGMENGRHFVQQPSGQTLWFRGLYDDDFIIPATGQRLEDALEQIDRTPLSDDAKLVEKLKLFLLLDPTIDYAGWWARQFRTLLSP